MDEVATISKRGVSEVDIFPISNSRASNSTSSWGYDRGAFVLFLTEELRYLRLSLPRDYWILTVFVLCFSVAVRVSRIPVCGF